MSAGLAHGHPPLKGEGRTAKGGPGWGGSDAAYAEALSPPPGPLARADLPPSGGGGRLAVRDRSMRQSGKGRHANLLMEQPTLP